MASRKAGRCEEGRAQWPCLETWSLRAIPVPKSSRRSYASPTQTSSLVSVASSAPNTTAVQENMHPRPVHKTEKFQATGRPGCCALAARICVALPGTPPASGEGSASRAIFSERRRLQERLRRRPLRGRLRPVSDKLYRVKTYGRLRPVSDKGYRVEGTRPRKKRGGRGDNPTNQRRPSRQSGARSRTSKGAPGNAERCLNAELVGRGRGRHPKARRAAALGRHRNPWRHKDTHQLETWRRVGAQADSCTPVDGRPTRRRSGFLKTGDLASPPGVFSKLRVVGSQRAGEQGTPKGVLWCVRP